MPCWSLRPPSPLDAEARLRRCKELLRLPEAGVLTAINKRIANILQEDAARRTPAVQGRCSRERGRADACIRVLCELARPASTHAISARRYAEALSALIALRAAVDEFFERIMVMDENPAAPPQPPRAAARGAALLGGVADLSRLPG